VSCQQCAQEDADSQQCVEEGARTPQRERQVNTSLARLRRLLAADEAGTRPTPEGEGEGLSLTLTHSRACLPPRDLLVTADNINETIEPAPPAGQTILKISSGKFAWDLEKTSEELAEEAEKKATDKAAAAKKEAAERYATITC